MKPYFIVLLVVVAAGLWSCKKKNANKVPHLIYQSMNPNTVRSGGSEDTVSITFQVEDGDGDLGNGSGKPDIFMTDSRSGAKIELPFPDIPTGTVTKGENVQAYCTVHIYAALSLLLRDDHPKGDTLTFDIYVKDIAGNESNTIKTPAIYITP